MREELLDVLEAFVGRLHCGAQSAGIEALRAADLTFSQMRTLLALAQNPDPVPIHEIATRLELSVAAAGRNVDQLVRTGLVDRGGGRTRSADEADLAEPVGAAI